MKKSIAPLLIGLIVIVLGVIGYQTFSQRQSDAEQANIALASPDDAQVLQVSGLIGSEKKEFFADPAVQQILQNKYQLSVNFETVGSRRIAVDGGANGTVDKYDFAFPAGVPAASKISENYPIKASYRVFFTPMAVASWQPVVDVLTANGIVSKQADHYAILDMHKLLELMDTQTRWKDLPNSEPFSIGRQVMIKSTDIRSSNSATMYLSLASYLFNDDQIVSSPEQVAAILPKTLPLFAKQGFMAGSSATPFEDYLIKGMGNSPLVMIYESQYLYQASIANSGIRDDMVLLYPKPTIFTQHTLLALTDNGKRLGDALTNDEDLQRLAIKHGFRSNNSALVSAF